MTKLDVTFSQDYMSITSYHLPSKHPGTNYLTKYQEQFYVHVEPATMAANEEEKYLPQAKLVPNIKCNLKCSAVNMVKCAKIIHM